MSNPLRGEIWRAGLDPVRGHEQSGIRPVLIVSDDIFNSGLAGLLVAIPVTSKNKAVPWHVLVEPPEAGLTMRSYIKCEEVRSLSADRFTTFLGKVSPEVMEAVEYRLRVLMRL